ncbi:MAG: flagellar basal body protein [Brevirhabdus sp.]
MNSNEVNLFALASRRLQWLADRQKVISENIANVNTAEYRAHDVESFESYLSNNARKVSPEDAQVLEVLSDWSEDFSGNNVVLEEQMMQAAETSGRYKLATSLYRKAHELVLTVASGR